MTGTKLDWSASEASRYTWPELERYRQKRQKNCVLYQATIHDSRGGYLGWIGYEKCERDALEAALLCGHLHGRSIVHSSLRQYEYKSERCRGQFVDECGRQLSGSHRGNVGGNREVPKLRFAGRQSNERRNACFLLRAKRAIPTNMRPRGSDWRTNKYKHFSSKIGTVCDIRVLEGFGLGKYRFWHARYAGEGI